MVDANLKSVDKIEILTLQDNYIEMTATDNSAVMTRAIPLKEGYFRQSVLAEHGFSAVVKTGTNSATKTLLFDFGFSEGGAAYNAGILGADLSSVEAIVLSHGHNDHTGGFDKLTEMIGKRNIPFVVHPAVFRHPRYLKVPVRDMKIFFSPLEREQIAAAGLKLVESSDPVLLLDNTVLFLGEIPHKTDFEKGFPIAHYHEDGQEKWDPIEDDTSVVMHLKDKGLVVLSGCAHAGIVNTVNYAREVTGIDKVHVIMGGFHLSGILFEEIIGRTVEELKKINPDYIIPCHCTGRKAIMEFEKAMSGKFILNMSGTKMSFAA
ncbi:MAG: MBL fold metallo-hydrolase [Syntrophales bacterium]|jgi:7,8-dihydropterin-6-yl-methyl-4-(beta-D-ribofuranosyl)aminobenzene 5'-phosphate synthase|nr:MBL fold metallo-hydrolase [Syntrophales bacterium]MCK9392863.1 MBL fold metallo-hydrolase [Syntrophales bacterium]